MLYFDNEKTLFFGNNSAVSPNTITAKSESDLAISFLSVKLNTSAENQVEALKTPVIQNSPVFIN